MAHVAKYNRGAMGHMLSHYDRSKDGLSGNIDKTRTQFNYNLAGELQLMKQLDFIHKRLGEVRCQNRKDVNVLCDWAITVPKDLPEQEHKAFFKSSYDFLEQKYGKENVISAYVHMDETTPHMHFAFVPVVWDEKKERYKVSAKECVNRRDLQSFHTDLQKYVERELGHKVGVLNEATKEGNRSIEELKRQSATERLQEATEKASEIVSKAQMQVQTMKDSLIAVKAEYEAKKAYVREADKVSQVSVMYPEESKVTEKGLVHKQRFVTVPAEMWEAKHISANEKSYLQKANEALESNLQEFRSTISSKNLGILECRIQELEKENRSLRSENRSLQSRVNRAEREAGKTIEKVNRVLSKLPDEMADWFVKEWKAPEHSRGFDMER